MTDFLKRVFDVAMTKGGRIRYGSVEVKIAEGGEFADVIVQERIRVFRDVKTEEKSPRHLRLDS